MKQGVDYFPLDTVLDSKFELIEADFGIKGFGVIVKLLQKIYAEQGYYVEFDKDIILVVAHRWGVNSNLVSDIVARAISVGIFDRSMFEKYRILTSVGIQRRYLKMTKKRAKSDIQSKYSLLELAQNPENAVFQEGTDAQKRQSKENESKKEKLNKKKYGELGNVELTDGEYEKLVDRYGTSVADKYIDKLSLYVESVGKSYKSHYATILGWLRKDGIMGKASLSSAYSKVRRFN